MDPKLAEMYGTNVPDEGDVEKLAAAEFADSLANDGQIDLDDLDPDAVEALSASILGEAGDEDDEDEEDDGQEKISSAEEADHLGRVMAHAYVHELRGIEKEAAAKQLGPAGNAGGKSPGAAGHARVAGRKAMGAAKGVLNAIKNNPKKSAGGVVATALTGVAAKKAHDHYKGKKKQAFALTAEGHKFDATRANAKAKNEHEHGKSEREYSRDAPIRSLMRGGPALGVQHTIAARHHDYVAKKHEDKRNAYNPFGGILTKSRHETKEKKSSAFGTLIEARAAEILAENGINPETLEPFEQEGAEQEKVSAADATDQDREILANLVEQGAWELLQEHGFQRSESEAEGE